MALTSRVRAAAIGHTGRGDFGHSLDVAWVGIEGVQVVAVADPDPDGRAAAKARTGAERSYASYREMLMAERPDVVSICPRWVDQRVDMVQACVEANVRAIYIEKPLAATLEDGRFIVELCRRSGVKLAVAHQSRVNPVVHAAFELIWNGDIGDVHTLSAHGKCDDRGGMEDLLVLGIHVFDLMRWIAGNVRSAVAHIQQGAEDATEAHVRPGGEGIGPIMGDRLHVSYAFDSGVVGHFQSLVLPEAGGRGYGLDVYGSKGIVSLRGGIDKKAAFYPFPAVDPTDGKLRWERIVPDATRLEPDWNTIDWHNRAIAKDLIACADEGREPAASGENALFAMEMAMAVEAVHRQGRRVTFPL